MSQVSDIGVSRELIDSREIHELAMSSHTYLQQAIWWVRLGRALDVLSEEIVCSNLAAIGHELATRNPHVCDQANALDAMGKEALEAINAARAHVRMFAGDCAQATHVRDSVRWVCKRVQLMNYLVEDLAQALSGQRNSEQGASGLRLLPSK